MCVYIWSVASGSITPTLRERQAEELVQDLTPGLLLAMYGPAKCVCSHVCQAGCKHIAPLMSCLVALGEF